MKAKTLTFAGAKATDVTLDEKVFGLPLRKDILHRVVQWQRARAQAGTHQTKQIGDIKGSTAKPFAQKGTGNARRGSNYAPHMRGGATCFGPQSRSHAFDLQKKVRKLGLKTALSAKQAEGKLFVISDAKLKESKTSDLRDEIAKQELGSVLFIAGNDVDTNFALASRNLYKVDILPQIGANVYDILNHDNLVLTADAVKALEERLA